MRNPRRTRRFGAHEVEKGRFKGSLHVATDSFKKLSSELLYLHDYLQRRLMPAEPEEILIRGIVLDLQNVLEHESEALIEYYVSQNPTKRNLKFKQQLSDGFVSFKTKFEWLMAKGMLTEHERDIMEEVRILRNAYIHARPIGKRPKLRYFGKALLTTTSVRQLFVDVEVVLQKLRSQSGAKQRWGTVPPGYATELKWSKRAISILDGE